MNYIQALRQQQQQKQKQCFGGGVSSSPLLFHNRHLFTTQTPRKLPSYSFSSCSSYSMLKVPPLQMSPSGIDTYPLLAQASIFISIYLTLGMFTTLSTKALEYISQSSSIIGLEKWRKYVISSPLPLLLGFVFVAAGTSHFVVREAFESIYPPLGTWGLWYLPGSAKFHVMWTGVVEFLGGFGLLCGGVRSLLGLDDDDDDENKNENEQYSIQQFLAKWIVPLSSIVLFVLVLLVTPANIYMYTHGATMPGVMDGPIDLSFHFIRFLCQIVLLTLLWRLALDSFFFKWGDELD